MVNLLWVLMIAAGAAVAASHGRIGVVTDAALASARQAVEMMLGLIGVMALWMGVMRVAEEAGLIRLLARALAPVARVLFPSIPRGHPALGTIVMNVAANLLGLGSAATPFGLKAMQELQTLNDDPETATDAMCTFLAINTSSVTLIPAAVLALRAEAGSLNPAAIVGPTLVATCCSTLAAVLADAALRRLGRRGRGPAGAGRPGPAAPPGQAGRPRGGPPGRA